MDSFPLAFKDGLIRVKEVDKTLFHIIIILKSLERIVRQKNISWQASINWTIEPLFSNINTSKNPRIITKGHELKDFAIGLINNYVLYTWKYSPLFYLHLFCPSWQQANLRLGVFLCYFLLKTLSGQIQDGAKLFAS